MSLDPPSLDCIDPNILQWNLLEDDEEEDVSIITPSSAESRNTPTSDVPPSTCVHSAESAIPRISETVQHHSEENNSESAICLQLQDSNQGADYTILHHIEETLGTNQSIKLLLILDNLTRFFAMV